MKIRKSIFAGIILVLGLVLFMAQECSFGSSQSTQDAQKEEIIKGAISQIPSYSPTHFMERTNVNERAKRFDNPNKIGYLYVFVGNSPIGYYTVKGKVSSLQSYMNSPDKVIKDSWGNVVVNDADIDGTYGDNIQGVFAFTTGGAYFEIPTTGTMGYMYSDFPLPINVPEFNVTVKK